MTVMDSYKHGGEFPCGRGGVENVGVDFAGRVQSGLVWREWLRLGRDGAWTELEAGRMLLLQLALHKPAAVTDEHGDELFLSTIPTGGDDPAPVQLRTLLHQVS